ncbi:MAG TPA: AAA family ATPase [Acidimicrobiales bacterium]|jgi:predicted ATPase|nr:AAA family ATPase [Acidimicrobiales bacterium]
MAEMEARDRPPRGNGPVALNDATATRRQRLLDLQGPVPVPAITRIRIKNFKSIGAADVALKPLTLLVGQNGAGKSNFLDAFRFTSDSLRSTVEYALRDRGGINEVRRRSRGHPTNFGIRLDLSLGGGWAGWYAFEISAKKNQGFEILREECVVSYDDQPAAYFTVQRGTITDSHLDDFFPDQVESDRLFLGLASGLPEFRRVYELLVGIGSYSLNLDAIRELQNPDPADLLQRDGGNLASVIRRVNEEAPSLAARVAEYLRAVVPGVRSVGPKTIGPKETIEFRQEVAGDPNPWRYLAANVSDGTLRALGVLVAVFQTAPRGIGIPVVTIEEPEIAVHPGAAVRLMDALLEASRARQVILTTHSPDLLDHPDLDIESVLVVESIEGNSLIGRVEDSLRQAVRDHLYTVGELLRLEQLRGDLFDREASLQLRLFRAQE